MALVRRVDKTPFDSYRSEFLANQLPGYARLGAGVALGINTAFIALDYVSFPEQFAFFLSMRLVLNALFVGIFFASGSYPRLSSWSICLSLGAAMVTMIYSTGGTSSIYFAGLMLLFLGMGVVLPLSGREAAGICGAILVPYLAMPLFESGAIDWPVFRIFSVFLISAAFESVASCTYLERMRFKDFTQRRELQEARDHLEQLDRAKSRFTANIHHELRTPLTLTLAPIEGMLDEQFGEISDLQRQYLKTAEANALRLLKLINNLLDLAKLESHQLTLHPISLELKRLVGDLLAGVRPMAERKGIELVERCGHDLPVIHADAEALEKIVVNLVGNALKFTESGGRITVELEAAEDEGGVLLRVIDTGIGLAEDQLRRIFDRFAQVDCSSTRKHEGTGIGLSLCHELVDLHGGQIWAESEGLGHGTRMCVWLPEGEASEGAEEAALEPEVERVAGADRTVLALEAEIDLGTRADHPSGASSSRDSDDGAEAVAAAEGAREAVGIPADAPQILVVDDNSDMRRLLAHLLSGEYHVRTASNGREALERVQEIPPHLVLTDVMMPEMSGTELCRTLKANPETSDIPVVLVTSKAERSMKIEGLEMGADDYVVKPFHARELLARVRSLLRVRLLQDELHRRNQRLEEANLRAESALMELKETQVHLVEQERLAAVGELAAGVAHEANNPLNFAANASRALIANLSDVQEVIREVAALESVDAEDARAAFEKLNRLCREKDFESSAETVHELGGIIEEGLDRTTRLVGNLLQFSGPEVTQPVRIDLAACVESTVRLMGLALREAEIEVVIDKAEVLPPIVGNPRALNQVFLNLIKNAKDAMKWRRGKISITITADDEAVSVRVRDEGKGVSDDIRDTLFEPFSTTKAAGEGTGLGLSISRNILHSMNGTLTLVESSGAGSCFEIRFPVPEDGAREA